MSYPHEIAKCFTSHAVKRQQISTLRSHWKPHLMSHQSSR